MLSPCYPNPRLLSHGSSRGPSCPQPCPILSAVLAGVSGAGARAVPAAGTRWGDGTVSVLILPSYRKGQRHLACHVVFFNPPLLIFKHPSLLLTLGSSPNTTPTMSMATDLNLLFPGHVGEAASGAHPSKGPRHSDTSASRKSGRQGPQTLGEVLLPVLYKFPNPIVFFPAQATFIC